MPSTEYARLRQLWTRYQSGDPMVSADTIRDHTSMDGVVVYDSLGRSSEQSGFEDGLRRPWETVSAWAESAARRGIIDPNDRLAASVEIWETGVLFYQLDAQRRPIRRSFAGLEPLSLQQAAELNQHPEAVQSTALTIGGVFTGSPPSGGGVVGPGSPIVLDGEITRTSLPARELSDIVAAQPSVIRPSFLPGPTGQPGGGLPSWIWIAVAGVAVYLLTKGR